MGISIVFIQELNSKIVISLQMRNYKCKTERGRYFKDAVEAAAEAVLKGGLSIRQSARENDINYKTLSRYIPIYKSKKIV